MNRQVLRKRVMWGCLAALGAGLCHSFWAMGESLMSKVTPASLVVVWLGLFFSLLIKDERLSITWALRVMLVGNIVTIVVGDPVLTPPVTIAAISMLMAFPRTFLDENAKPRRWLAALAFTYVVGWVGRLLLRGPEGANPAQIMVLLTLPPLLLGLQWFLYQQLLTKLEYASQAKSQFLANISHELRTPLTTIMGYSEIVLEEHQDDETLSEDMEKIRTASVHLLDLIADILDLSKVEAGQMSYDLRPYDLRDGLEALAPQAKVLALRNTNELFLEPSPQALEVVLDAHRFHQIGLNLISNAAKFTEDGVITLRVYPRGEEGCFEVEDTGIGLSPEQIERVIKPFEQATDTTHARFGGTGLGLALVHRLVLEMEGELSIESSPGSGSTFRVTFPLVG